MLSRLVRSKRRSPIVDVSLEALSANPFPVYRWLREHKPVAHAPAANYYWLVTRWDDVVTVLKDEAVFSAAAEPGNFPEQLCGSLLYQDGQEHSRARSSMQAACQPRHVAAFADAVVPDLADTLIDRLDPGGTGDLVRFFFEPLAARTVQELTGLEGLEPRELETWVDHAANYFKGDWPPPEADSTNRSMAGAIARNLQRLRNKPDSSLLSAALHWRDDAGSLPERQIVANAMVFLAAGVHELRDLMAHTLIGLLTRPEQLAELRSDPSLARAAIDEGARWASPVGIVPRQTTVEVELSGARIPASALVAPVLASANRDERRWTAGSRFDLRRDEGMHLAFASGPHFCLGAWLARAVGAVALNRLVQRLPNLRLSTDDQPVVRGWRFREVQRLPVMWGGR